MSRDVIEFEGFVPAVDSHQRASFVVRNVGSAACGRLRPLHTASAPIPRRSSNIRSTSRQRWVVGGRLLLIENMRFELARKSLPAPTVTTTAVSHGFCDSAPSPAVVTLITHRHAVSHPQRPPQRLCRHIHRRPQPSQLFVAPPLSPRLELPGLRLRGLSLRCRYLPRRRCLRKYVR